MSVADLEAAGVNLQRHRFETYDISFEQSPEMERLLHEVSGAFETADINDVLREIDNTDSDWHSSSVVGADESSTMVVKSLSIADKSSTMVDETTGANEIATDTGVLASDTVKKEALPDSAAIVDEAVAENAVVDINEFIDVAVDTPTTDEPTIQDMNSLVEGGVFEPEHYLGESAV